MVQVQVCAARPRAARNEAGAGRRLKVGAERAAATEPLARCSCNPSTTARRARRGASLCCRRRRCRRAGPGFPRRPSGRTCAVASKQLGGSLLACGHLHEITRQRPRHAVDHVHEACTPPPSHTAANRGPSGWAKSLAPKLSAQTPSSVTPPLHLTTAPPLWPAVPP